MLAQVAVRNTGAAVEAPPWRCRRRCWRSTVAPRRFAARYAGLDPVRENERAVDRIEQLVGRAAPPMTAPLIGLAGAPFARML